MDHRGLCFAASGWETGQSYVPILHIHANDSQYSHKQSRIVLFISEVPHRPTALVIEHK